MAEVGEEATPLNPKKQKNVLLNSSNKTFSEDDGICGKVGSLCCSVLCNIVTLVVLNGLSVGSIVIGSLYLDKTYCPGQPNLAIALIAVGSVAILLSIFEGRSCIASASGERTTGRDCYYFALIVLRLAKLSVFIYLCVLVFSLYPNVETIEPDRKGPDGVNYYCQPTLFFLAFWVVMVVLALGTVGVLIACCTCSMAALLIAGDND